MSIHPAEREQNVIPSQEGFNIKKPVSNRIFHYEGYRGNTMVRATVQAFIGPTRKIYLDHLRERAVQFDQAIFIIPEDQARREVFQNMKAKSGSMLLVRERDPKIPEESFAERMRAVPERVISSVATVLMRQAPKVPEVRPYLRFGDIGYTTQQLLTFQIDGKTKKVMYVSTLAFLPAYRRMGFAAKCLQIANALYQPDYIALRLRGGAAYAALLKSRLLDKTTISPFKELWDKDAEKAALLKVLDENTAHPNPIDPVTGISEELYAEGWDRAYRPDPNHKIAREADQQLYDLGLRPYKGDAAYVGGKVVGRSQEESFEEFIAV